MAITRKLLDQNDSCSRKFVGCDDLRLDINLKKATAAFKKLKQIINSLTKRCGVEIDGMSELWDSMKCKGESGSIQDGISSLSRSLKTEESAPKLCGLKQYAARNIDPFKNRLFSSSNPDRALDGFRTIADFISKAPKNCDFQRAPCGLTYFPKNENICQLGDRAVELFKLVENECGEKIETDFSVVLKSFKEDIKPVSGKCSKNLMTPSERSQISQFKQNTVSDEDIRQLVIGEIAFPGKRCSLKELMIDLPKIKKHLVDKKFDLKKNVKKIVDRAGEILDYMMFANFQNKCSEEIRVPCEFMSAPRKHDEIAKRIAMLSHYFTQHCDNFDFVAQYLSNAFTK